LLKIQDGAYDQYSDFGHLFLEALAFFRNFRILKFLHILEEQTQNKKKICCPKINSKWPLNSKLILFVKTTNRVFSKKKKKSGLF
jgi:hypothetical protein